MLKRTWAAFGMIVAGSIFSLEAYAAVIWAPMWDQRDNVRWFVKASSSTVTFSSDHDFSTFRVYDGATLLGTSSGGDHSLTLSGLTVGNVYEMRYLSGFHVRPHWDGVEWVRLGEGTQAAGPGTNRGFQSDAELGFDSRWGSLPSQYADTTWFYNVGAGEQLSISVEHMTGDIHGSKRYDWVRPDGVVVTADANGMPGSGAAHFQARGGSLAIAPNPASVYWEEYVAPVAMAGWWGFKLTANDPATQSPYSWHYVLDRTDAGADQFNYLRVGSIADPNRPLPNIPLPGTLALLGAGFLGLGLARRIRRP